MKNIAVSLNAGTPLQRNAITNFFAHATWAYWHWIDDFWIVQAPDAYTPKALYDQLCRLENVDTATILLFEFYGNIGFWGRADNAAWEWLNHIGTAK
jgi:hypothetical protein